MQIFLFFVDRLKRATDIVFGGMKIVVCGYGEVRKLCSGHFDLVHITVYPTCIGTCIIHLNKCIGGSTENNNNNYY